MPLLVPLSFVYAMLFVDLCAGIGGFRLGLQALGHKCVYACEIDGNARAAYGANFGHEPESDDVMLISSTNLPAHDIVCCGFPCRTFSCAGKKECDLRLISHVIDHCTAGAKYIMLENAANFASVNKRSARDKVIAKLAEAGFVSCHDSVYNTGEVAGLPQPRRRWLCIAAKAASVLPQNIAVPRLPLAQRKVLQDVLRSPAEFRERSYVLYTEKTHSHGYPSGLKPKTRRPDKTCWVGSRTRHHRQHSRVYHRLGLGCTLTASGRVYVYEPQKMADRLLTVNEMVAYMGFPADFHLPNRKRTAATRLLGSAIPPPLVKAFATACGFGPSSSGGGGGSRAAASGSHKS